MTVKHKIPNLLKPLGFQKKCWSFYPSESFSFDHFTLIHPVVDLETRLVPSNDLLLLTAHSDFQTFHHLCFCVPRLYKSNAQEHLKSLKLINWIKGNKSENVFFCFCSIHNSKVIINILLGRTVWVWFCDKTEEMN